MKSPRLRSLPQKYSPKSILRDITTYFEDSVFPIREINTKSCMHSSAFYTSLYPSLSKRQKDKKAHDSFEDSNEEKEADQQGKKQKAKAMFS